MEVVNNGLTIEINGALGHFPKEFVISALEKQIPKKPILDTIFPSGVKWYFCPACKHNGIEKTGAYCHNCGQALDWGDDK